jgi:DNA-binding FadR family transcriptional regulator
VREPDFTALLRDRIETGRLVGRLPAERILMRRYRVGRRAVRRALAGFRADGLIVTERGSGSYTAGTEPGLASQQPPAAPAGCPRCGYPASQEARVT